MTQELRVNWILCDGYGLCGDLLPELIGLDDWRYPIIREGGVPKNCSTPRSGRSIAVRCWRFAFNPSPRRGIAPRPSRARIARAASPNAYACARQVGS